MNKVLLGIMIVALIAATAFATTYRWPPGKRPPISIEQAYAIASKRAATHVEGSYCTGAHLLGNEAQDGKEGAWNFAYHSEAGDFFFVSVHMDGKVTIQGK